MQFRIGITASFFFFAIILFGQNEDLPFREISDYPESYSAETVTARLIEGLGFRFYWATEGIKPENLDYKPNEDGRSYIETVDHIYGLTNVVLNTALGETNKRNNDSLDFEGKRKAVLNNLNTVLQVLKDGKKLDKMMTIFKNANGTTELPFWNQINGPISDAIWHCGQLVLLRRSAGNPLPKGPNFFNGKVN